MKLNIQKLLGESKYPNDPNFSPPKKPPQSPIVSGYFDKPFKTNPNWPQQNNQIMEGERPFGKFNNKTLSV